MPKSLDKRAVVKAELKQALIEGVKTYGVTGLASRTKGISSHAYVTILCNQPISVVLAGTLESQLARLDLLPYTTKQTQEQDPSMSFESAVDWLAEAGYNNPLSMYQTSKYGNSEGTTPLWGVVRNMQIAGELNESAIYEFITSHKEVTESNSLPF